MHEKSLERIDHESKQRFACDKCDIKQSTKVLIKGHKKLVLRDMKRNLSEMRKRPKSKATASPPSLSPPTKKAKEDDTTTEEEDLETRIENLKRPKTNNQQIKFEDLERLRTASGKVIANLDEENNQLHAKAEFHKEVAESLSKECLKSRT